MRVSDSTSVLCPLAVINNILHHNGNCVIRWWSTSDFHLHKIRSHCHRTHIWIPLSIGDTVYMQRINSCNSPPSTTHKLIRYLWKIRSLRPESQCSIPKTSVPRRHHYFPTRMTSCTTCKCTGHIRCKHENYLICQSAKNILKLLLENAIEHSFLAGIHSATLGFGTRTLQDIFLHLYQSYGWIILVLLQLNMTKLTTPVAPHLPIALFFWQIKDYQWFALTGGTSFIAEQLLKAAETLVLSTGKYQIVYRECIGLPIVQNTSNNFRIRFYNKYMIQNKTMQSTMAQQQVFAGNVTEERQLNDAVVKLRKRQQPITHRSPTWRTPMRIYNSMWHKYLPVMMISNISSANSKTK